MEGSASIAIASNPRATFDAMPLETRHLITSFVIEGTTSHTDLLRWKVEVIIDITTTRSLLLVSGQTKARLEDTIRKSIVPCETWHIGASEIVVRLARTSCCDTWKNHATSVATDSVFVFRDSHLNTIKSFPHLEVATFKLIQDNCLCRQLVASIEGRDSVVMRRILD